MAVKTVSDTYPIEYNQNDSLTRMYNVVSGLDQNYSYDVKDQLLGMTSYQGSNTTSYSYGYDSFGNMTEKSNVGSMAYDAGNRLTSLTRNNGTTVNYRYDANGNQISGTGRMIKSEGSGFHNLIFIWFSNFIC